MSQMKALAVSLLCFLLGAIWPTQADARTVALELVLAVDTSSSVDKREFELQRRGFAAAFSNPNFISVIEGMSSLGIAVSLVEWAGTSNQKVVIDWRLIDSREASLKFAQDLANAPRPLSGLTDIGSAIRFSVSHLENNAFEGNRLVIDVSGDGSSSVEGSARERDRAIKRGVTINGLVILNTELHLGQKAEVDLIQHYSNQVVGGNGSFLMTTESFEDFESAILNKLLREIIGTATASTDSIEENRFN